MQRQVAVPAPVLLLQSNGFMPWACSCASYSLFARDTFRLAPRGFRLLACVSGKGRLLSPASLIVSDHANEAHRVASKIG